MKFGRGTEGGYATLAVADVILYRLLLYLIFDDMFRRLGYLPA